MPYIYSHNDIYELARVLNVETHEKGDELWFKYCPYCHGGGDDKDTFSINLESGVFHCFRSGCMKSGHFVEMARDFGFHLENDNVPKRYKRLPQKQIVVRDPAVEFMKIRGISEETTRKYQITTRNDRDDIIVFPFYDENNVLVFVKYRNANHVKGQGPKEWCEKDAMPILFGMNHCEGFERLIICEGQLDSLSVSDCGISNAVSVPNGCNGFTFLDNVWDWIVKFQEVVVFGDCEKGKITLLDTLAKRLPVKVKGVRPEDYLGEKDANDIYRKYGKQAILTAIENAEVPPVKHVKELADVQSVDLFNLPKIRTGLKELDSVIGGLYFGQVVLLTGKRGEGKLLADDTPVFTRKGWKNHGDLQVGDEVVGRYGEWVKVTHVFPKHYANMKIKFSNGDEICCHENHEWVVCVNSDYGEYETIIESKEMLQRFLDGKKTKIIERAVYVVSVSSCEHKPGNCIEVEGGIYCAGKTMIPTHNSTLLSQLLVEAMDQNYSIFAYSGELADYHFKRWMDFQAAGPEFITTQKSMYGEEYYQIPNDIVEKINAWYRGRAYIYDNNSVDDNEMESLISTIEHTIQRYDVKVIAVDNLMTAMDFTGDDIYKAQSAFVKALKNIALKYNVVVILVAHPRKTQMDGKPGAELGNDDVSGSSDITNRVDLVMAYSRNYSKTNPDDTMQADSRLSVTKNRLTGKLTQKGKGIDLFYSQKSKRISSVLSKDKSYGWQHQKVLKPNLDWLDEEE